MACGKICSPVIEYLIDGHTPNNTPVQPIWKLTTKFYRPMNAVLLQDNKPQDLVWIALQTRVG